MVVSRVDAKINFTFVVSLLTVLTVVKPCCTQAEISAPQFLLICGSKSAKDNPQNSQTNGENWSYTRGGSRIFSRGGGGFSKKIRKF